MTIRSHGYRPRRAPQRRRFVGPALLGGGLAAVVVVGGFAMMGAPVPGPTPTPIGLIGASPTPSPSAVTQPPTSGSPEPGRSGEPTPAPTPTPTPTPRPLADVPIVPVTDFRSPVTRIGRADLAALVAGTGRFESLELVEADADGILAALDLSREALGDRLVLARGPVTLGRDLAKNRDRLGFLRLRHVTEAVRALGWGNRNLFGVDRVPLGEWRLSARIPGDPPREGPEEPLWTLVAGGDILLDRGVSLAIRDHDLDFPFDGGTAEITSRYCCSSFGWELPRTRRTGDAGAMRDLLRGADIAIANFENPAPNAFRFHGSGTVFSANPAHIEGLANAGIDWVSLANNHIGDAGRTAIVQTIANLEKHGIKSSGAGKNLAAARAPSYLDVGDIRVALLGYDTIARYYKADADTPGSVQLSPKVVEADVKKARQGGADLVIVFPHWGTEYDPTPFAGQRALAHAAIDAGADMVIGNHAHWAGAVEVYEDKPIFYALGNFVFDQTWSEPTMEGITVEMTFRGTDLVQIRLRPHLILDRAQPNFLDPVGDGRVVLSQVFAASKGLLPW